MYDLKVYKTHEIDEELWNNYTNVFNKIFKRDNDPLKFRKYFQSNIFGYSYHAIAITKSDKTIIGSTSIFPYIYNVNIKEMFIGLSGTSFVEADYRKDIFIFKKMYDAVKEIVHNDGVKAIAGIPNKNSRKYSELFLKTKYIGDLRYKIIPIQLFRLLGIKNKYFNLLFKIMVVVYFQLLKIPVYLLRSKNEKKIHIKDKWDFYSIRYGNLYHRINNKDYNALFRLYKEEKGTVCYLMDYESWNNKRSYNIIKFVLNIIKNYDIDAIVYIGTQKFNPLIFIPIPIKYVPQEFPFTIDIIDKEYESELSNFNDWDFSLGSFDVR